MPVKHCLCGTGSSDSRFPHCRFCEGVRFVPFAKPTRTLETYALVGAKPAGVPTASLVSAKFYLFLFLEAVGISHTKGASEPVK